MSGDPRLTVRMAGAIELSALAARFMRDAAALLRAARCLADPAQPISRSTCRLRRYIASRPDNSAEVAAIVEAIEADDPGAERRGRMRRRSQRDRTIAELWHQTREAARTGQVIAPRDPDRLKRATRR